MRKMYQDHWLGIDFREFASLDSERLADTDFYDRFYQELFRRYSAYEAFPADWRNNKGTVASFLLEITKPQDRLLSIGCGSGYVEALLSQAGRRVTAIEPSRQATRLLANCPDVTLINGFFPDCLPVAGSPAHDIVYLNAMEYCLDEPELTALLREVYLYPCKTIIVISACVYQKYALGRLLKDYLKELLRVFSVRHPGQFWGYKRTREELGRAVGCAGYAEVQSGLLRSGYLWIKGKRR